MHPAILGEPENELGHAVTRSALLKPSVDRTYPVVARGQGVFLYDRDGNQYLDGSSGPMAAAMGHGSREIADAMRKQAEQVAFSYRTQFTNEPAEMLAERLTALAPGDLTRAFFVSSGSEATEFSMRAAIGYWKERGLPSKVKILSRERSYHGMTLGALSMSGHPGRRPDYGTLLHTFPVAPPAYPYRFAHEHESEDAYAERSAREFEQAIVDEDPRTVAAVIVEPIVGAAGGAIVPPGGYLKRLREICDRLGVLLIADEVITGIGRTGDWFACEHEGIVPDLMALGKGLSGGYSPIAGVLMREHVAEAFEHGSGITPFGHTFSGNPLSAATCLAVLDIMQRDNILQNVRERGAQLQAGLERLSHRYECLSDVRGRGLLWGFEFVTDRQLRTPPPESEAINERFVHECWAERLIVYPAGVAPLNNAAIVSPPLIISQSEVEILLQRLEGAVRRISGFLGLR